MKFKTETLIRWREQLAEILIKGYPNLSDGKALEMREDVNNLIHALHDEIWSRVVWTSRGAKIKDGL